MTNSACEDLSCVLCFKTWCSLFCSAQQVQDKFRLDLNDEEAVQHINNVIDVSVSATVAAVFERLHGLAQVGAVYLL